MRQSKAVVVGFLAGCGFAAAVSVPLLWVHGRAKEAHGRHLGRIDGRQEAMRALEREFGVHDGAGGSRGVFSSKAETAVAVSVNGVETVRVVR